MSDTSLNAITPKHVNYEQVMRPKDAAIPVAKIPGTAKGFMVLTPSEQIVFNRWKGKIQSTFQLHGFSPLEVSPFVHRKFLVQEGGIDSQIFSVCHLRDGSDTSYGLAFDRTVPFALWARDNMKGITFPYKRYDVSLSFRAESQTKTGRMNGFYQADVDIIGKKLSLTADVECITTLVNSLVQLQIPSFTVYLNHIEIPKQLVKRAGFQKEEEALRLIDKLDKTPKEEIEKELVTLDPNVPPETIKSVVEVCAFRGSIEEFKFYDAIGDSKIHLKEIEEILSLIKSSGLDPSTFKFAPGIVRGLNYYTGIVFETLLNKYPKHGSITSGGRYDRLVDTFTDKPTGIQGVGGSIGLTRLFDVLRTEKEIMFQTKTAAKVVVLVREGFYQHGVMLSAKLRKKEIATDLYSGSDKTIKKQLKYSAEIKASLAVLVMDEKNYTIRLLSIGMQTSDIDNIPETVKKVKNIIRLENRNMISYVYNKSEALEIGANRVLAVDDFVQVVYKGRKIDLNETSAYRLSEARGFIQYLLEKEVKVYGLTTGFADLRNKTISSKDAAQLSQNILQSHDAGIGPVLPPEVVKGAMVISANSLSKGYSGIKPESLRTLISMINANIIPLIPSVGSLGASGDLAFLARLGQTMQGIAGIKVLYEGQEMEAKEALRLANIVPFKPEAKEGLALTNGTPFMASMLTIAYLRQIHIYENIIALTNLYLNATRSIDAAFNDSIQSVRKQKGQTFVAKILQNLFKDSPLIDSENIQNDYSQRCLPQIFGPKFEQFFSLRKAIFSEIDAVTDNPLIYRRDEISDDISEKRKLEYQNEEWCVLSGGNFHGEVITTAADSLVAGNAKIALTMERHLTFLLNPARNKSLFPDYLIPSAEKAGLQSGFMIVQYTANSLTQKICQLAHPVSNFNLTSANESEDIVSYGPSAVQKLMEQLELLSQLTTLYCVATAQAYGITRENYKKTTGNDLNPELPSEQFFAHMSKLATFPVLEEPNFPKLYGPTTELLASHEIRKTIGFPIARKFGMGT